MLPASVAETASLLEAQGYVADTELATTVYLALAMRRPLFLEGRGGYGEDGDREGAGGRARAAAGAAAML